ncbi:angiopoietin-related protein 7-like [Anopheles ziemanni]|uniref:angiopoietin-related protein 7-like n=1 Tax=Anopheles coustani TaxID=139045 RepID=UPI00265878D9|nr:angiopoietin-related protein 7-like [Anopheles coustani]XP_058178401.1 angiopoietin-related protein 7-like [Anopheles ziemanni]
MPNQCRCDSVQVNNDIGGFQFELLLAHLGDFQSVMEDRYESSLSQITSILERLESRMDALESRMEKRFENSTSQIMTRINQTETKIETSSSQFLDMMRHLHTKVDVLESRMKERYDNSSQIAERLEEKVDIGILNLLHQSPMHRLDKYVQDLGISTLHNPWTTIQQRVNESIGFYRNWKSYKNGFGHQEGEFWIGLQPLYQMIRSAKHELLIVLEDFDGKIKHALYDDFKIGSEDENYVLEQLGEYSGTAGNSFKFHVDMPFSTHLNGKYYQQPVVQKMLGLTWYHWHGDYYSLKSTKMMTRRGSANAD